MGSWALRRQFLKALRAVVSAEIGHNPPRQPLAFKGAFPALQVRPTQVQAESGRACILKRISKKDIARWNLDVCQACKNKDNSEPHSFAHDKAILLGIRNPNETRKLFSTDGCQLDAWKGREG